MRNSNPLTEQKTKALIFTQFCENRGWSFESLARNKNNMSQYIGRAYDEKGMSRTVLITATGKFVELLGGKKWRELQYAKEATEET